MVPDSSASEDCDKELLLSLPFQNYMDHNCRHLYLLRACRLSSKFNINYEIVRSVPITSYNAVTIFILY